MTGSVIVGAARTLKGRWLIEQSYDQRLRDIAVDNMSGGSAEVPEADSGVRARPSSVWAGAPFEPVGTTLKPAGSGGPIQFFASAAEARLVQKLRGLACHPRGTRRSEAFHHFALPQPSS